MLLVPMALSEYQEPVDMLGPLDLVNTASHSPACKPLAQMKQSSHFGDEIYQ